MKEPDLEKINALKPQLIVISADQQGFKADLERIAPVLDLSMDQQEGLGIYTITYFNTCKYLW